MFTIQQGDKLSQKWQSNSRNFGSYNTEKIETTLLSP